MAKKALIEDWFQHAENDVVSAGILFEHSRPRQTEIAAYHCQQCAEKSLKAVLVANDIDPPRTHDLVRLLELCKNLSGDFSQLEPQCKRLAPLGSELRYPNELAADEAMVKTALADAQSIYTFCIAKVFF